MFLHSGASLHGHEYSSKTAPVGHQQHTHRRSPLLRSAFASPKPRPISLDGAAHQSPSTPKLIRRPVSDFIPRATEPVVRFLEPLDSEDDLPTPMTEDHVSVSGSEFSDSSQAGTLETPGRKRSRRPTRTATTYALAYPAPRFAGKSRMVKKVAPKLYLQLQEVSVDKRPKPMIDVFPSSRIAGPVIAPRLAKRFPRLFGPKGELGSHDVVLMRSENYGTASEDADSDEDETGMESRQPVAVLSPVRKLERTEIVLDDGSVWVAKCLPTGSFDFVHVNAHGVATTARWARRPSSLSTSGASESKYTFSIINPLSRRHPVMATLTPSFLNIQDSYTSVSTSSGRYPPSKPLIGRVNTMVTPRRPSPLRPASSRSLSMNAAEDESENTTAVPELEDSRTTHPVDDATKLLISVTAVWLALQSGWSPFYTPPTTCQLASDPQSESVTSGSATASSSTMRLGRKGTRSRGNSIEIANLPPPPHAGPTGIRSRESSPVRSFLSGTHLPPWWETRTISSPVSPPAPVRSPTPDQDSPLPRRATSTGAAYMTRARIASISKLEEESDPEHPKNRPRILSGGGCRTLVRPAPAQLMSTDDKGKDSDSIVKDRSSTIRLPRGGRQVQNAHLPRTPTLPSSQEEPYVKHALKYTAPVQQPLMVVPEVPVVVAVPETTRQRGHFGTKIRNIGQWFRRLGAHSGMH